MAVVFKADSDFSKVIKDYETLQRQNVALKEKMAGVTKEVKEQGSGLKATFESGIGQLKAMVGTYLSVSGAISLVNAGLQDQKRISQEIHRVQMSAADAESQLSINMGDVSKSHATKFISDVKELSRKSGIESVVPSLLAAKDVVSSGMSEEMTLAILTKTLPLMKATPASIPAFSAAVGDLVTVTKSGPADIDRLMSLVLTSQKYSRGTSLESFSEVIKGISGGMGVDSGKDRVRAATEGMKFSGAIGQALKDPNSAESKTAWAEMATQLEMFLPEFDKKTSTGKLLRKGSGLQTGMQRLERIQSDEKLKLAFFEKAPGYTAPSWRGAVKPVMESLVKDPNSPIAIALRQANAGIKDDPGVFGRILENATGATAEMVLTGSTREVDAEIEAFQIESSKGNLALARGTLEKGLRQTGGLPGSSLFNQAEEWAFEGRVYGGENPLVAAEDSLRRRQREILYPGFSDVLGTKGDRAQRDPEFMRQEGEKLGKDEKAKFDVLERLIAIMEKQLQLSSVGGTAAAARDLQLNRGG